MRVSTVDDDVALLKMWLELRDEGVNRRTSLDEENDLARMLEFGYEL